MSEEQWIQSKSAGRPVDEALVDSLLVERMIHVLESPTFAIRNYFKCVHKETSRLVLQDQFVGQTALGYAIDWQRSNGYAQRVIAIKPRQVGWTQELIARAVQRALIPHSNSVVFMPDGDVIKKQSPRVGTIINNLPEWMHPMIRIDNQTMWEFDNPDSKARGDDPGLGSTLTLTVPGGYRGAANINFVDFEEFAHWDTAKGDPNSIMNAIMQGMGKHANTCAVICTTPNGHDQYYEPRVRQALERNPKWVKRWKKKGPWTREEIRAGALGEPDRPNTWIPIFSRWCDHDEYCVVAGTMVNTCYGLKPVETIVAGEHTPFGPVTDTFVFRNRQVARLTTHTGRTLTCTPHHPVFTSQGWVLAGEAIGKYIKLEPPEFAEDLATVEGVQITPATGRFLGYFMADGSLTSEGHMDFACSQDADVVGDVQNLLTDFVKHFTPKSKSTPVGQSDHNGATYVRKARKGFVSWFKAGGMHDGKKRIVCVPDCIFRSPKSVVRQFLRGLFEGDGNCPSHRGAGVALHSKYHRFVLDVQLLLLGFGINAHVYRSDLIRGGVVFEGWALNLRTNDSVEFIESIGFISERKRKNGELYAEHGPCYRRLTKDMPGFEKIVSIEGAGTADVYDISVPKTKQFVANGMLVHNTTKDESPTGHLPRLTKKEVDRLLRGRVGEERIGTVERYGGDEETMLMRDHGVSIYQLAWRRVAIDDADQPDWRSKLLYFRQENATTVDDCFISYGRAPFSKIALDEIYRNQIKDPLCHGMLRKETRDGAVEIYMDTTWISQWGEIRVWALPSTEHRYIIAVDPASAYESEDSDWTVAVVLRRHDEKQVAVYRTKAQMHDVEQQLALLYEWYNRPLLAVETDAAEGYGLSHNLYHHHNVKNQYFWKRLDTAITKSTEYLGWQTDPKTRPVMQSTLVHAMAQLEDWVKADRPGAPPLCIRDLETWREMSSCERDVYGKIEGVGDNHDDLVLALMIALAVNRDPDYGSPLLRAHEPERPRDAQALMQNYAMKFGSARRSLNRPEMSEL
jgi:hypothetical protein